MENKVIVVGYGGSGKDYLVDKLVTEKGMKRSVSYTTRPMRKGEKNGTIYNFVDKETFIKMVENGEFHEWEEFKQGWYYGCTKESFEECDLFIKTVGGLSQMTKENRKKCTVVFLDIPKEVILERLNERNDNNDDSIRRMEADERDFKDFDDYDIRIYDPLFDYEVIYSLLI